MKLRKKNSGGFLCALLTGNSFSQELIWEKSYGGKQEDIPPRSAKSPDFEE